MCKEGRVLEHLKRPLTLGVTQGKYLLFLSLGFLPYEMELCREVVRTQGRLRGPSASPAAPKPPAYQAPHPVILTEWVP